METALNIASFAFLGTVAFGVALAAYALWGYLSRRRFRLATPTLERLPTRALDVAKQALEKQKTRFFRASGERRTRYGHEVQRLEMRIQHLQQRTNEDQFHYYQLCRRRENVWKEWRHLFERLDFMHGQERRGARIELTALVKQYHDVERLVRDEWHRAHARDELNLQELQTQGVLVMEPEPGERAAGGAETGEAEPGEAEPAAPESANEAEGEDGGTTLGRQPDEPGARKAELSRALSEAPPGFAGVPAMGAMHQDDFALADLPKAGLRYADPEFSMADVPGGSVEGANLSGCSFAGVRFAGVQVFRRCHFARADLSRVSLLRAEQPHQFVECDFSQVNFSAARLEFALFVRCVFAASQWAGARLDRVKFAECSIAGTRWDGLDLSRVIMSPEMLAQGDFSQALAPPRAPAPSPYERAAAPNSVAGPARPAPVNAAAAPNISPAAARLAPASTESPRAEAGPTSATPAKDL